MTELPDDMEGRLARIEAAIEQSEVFGFKTTNPAIADLRALLLAYQERGRALERIEAGLPEIRAVHRFGEARLIARAALSQKGKSHD
jgi:hypothetical protein